MPKCAYCRHANLISGGEEIFCLKKGLTEPNDNCKAYFYDPLKRVPKVQGIGKDYEPEDLKL